jgi:hypothetical protein
MDPARPPSSRLVGGKLPHPNQPPPSTSRAGAGPARLPTTVHVATTTSTTMKQKRQGNHIVVAPASTTTSPAAPTPAPLSMVQPDRDPIEKAPKKKWVVSRSGFPLKTIPRHRPHHCRCPGTGKVKFPFFLVRSRLDCTYCVNS